MTAIERAYIGVGANLGDPLAAVSAAVRALGRIRETSLVSASRPWRSASIGGDGPAYVNAAAAVDTRLDPHDLLDALLSIERDHGRERSTRNAPRTLDLDLLLYGERRLHSAALTVPHPRLHERRFVLGPLLEIAPSISIPGIGAASAALPSTGQQDAAPLPGSTSLA